MSVFKSLTAGALLMVAASAGARIVPAGYHLVDYKLVRNTMPPQAVGTVPEPATWAMMLAGFGLIGVVRRRDRRRSEVA